MFKCTSCGRQLHWYSDFNLDEVYDLEHEPDDEGVVGIYSCGHCELDYEITTYGSCEHMRVIIYEQENDEIED